MTTSTIRRLDPAQYRRSPWKNGGGTTVDIAGQDDIWRFGRTPITAPGPFSDYIGFNRVQVLVAGRGLVLVTPDGEIDVRTPFKPVRFKGETPIKSRLEAGPVEVVNLIGKRSDVAIDLVVLAARVVADIAGVERPQPGRKCLAGEANAERAREHLRKQREDGGAPGCGHGVRVTAPRP